MTIDVRLRTQHDSLALRQFAEHTLRRKLGARDASIRRASVRLEDVNGPRRGVDKVCRVRLTLADGGVVSVTGTSTGWYEAVSLAVMSARAAVEKRRGRALLRRAHRTQPRSADIPPTNDPSVGIHGRNIA